MSVLAVEVGNGSTSFGLFVAGELAGTLESSTPLRLTVDEARAQARSIVDRYLSANSIESAFELGGAILSCVVPAHTDVWRQALSREAASRALVVGPGLKTGVRMRQDDPSSVGSDRVANVVAARQALGAPAVVVDVGTTTNIEVIDETGAFAGGVICPGIMVGARALGESTALLPMVELQVPRSVVGRSTREAMQAGVVLGEVARVDGLLNMVMAEMGREAPIVMTGRYAQVIAPLLRHDVTVDDSLTLRGLAHLWYERRGRSAGA